MNPQIIDFAFVFSLSASPVLERKKKEIQFLRFYKKTFGTDRSEKTDRTSENNIRGVKKIHFTKI